MAALALLFPVLEAVITLGLSGIPGFSAGFGGSIDKEFLQRLASFKVAYLAPCLIISSLGARLSFERLVTVLPLVFWSCAQIITGFLIARMLRHMCSSTKGSLVQFLQVAIMFQNIGNYNFPLLRSMCSNAELFPDHSNHCFEDGVLMIFGYHLPFDLGMWTFGYASIQAVKDAEKDSDAELAEKPSVSEVPRFGFVSNPVALITSIKHCLNPVVTAMLVGMVIGLTPALRTMFFARDGALRLVGESFKRIGEATPVMGLQILTATLGSAARKIIEIQKTKKKVHDEIEFTAPDSDSAAQNASSGPKSVSHGWWIASVILGKLVLLPLFGFAIFMALGTQQSPLRQPPKALDNGTGAAFLAHSSSSIPGDSSTSTYSESALSDFLWPKDRLFRAIVVMQWSAPSCMTLIVMCHKVGLDQSMVQDVAVLYLIMYAVAAAATTFWVTLGLAFF